MQCLGAEMEKTKIASHQCAHVQGTLCSEDAGALKGPCRNQGGKMLDGWRETPRRKHVLTQTIPFYHRTLTCSSFPRALVSSCGCNRLCFPSMQWSILPQKSALGRLMKSYGWQTWGWRLSREIYRHPRAGMFLDGISVPWLLNALLPQIWHAPSLPNFFLVLCVRYIFVS